MKRGMKPDAYARTLGLQQARVFQLLRTPVDRERMAAKTGNDPERLLALSQGSLITLIEAVVLADAAGVDVRWLAGMRDVGGPGEAAPCFPQLVREGGE